MFGRELIDTFLVKQEDTPSETGAVELNAQGKPKRKRKRDTHQQELNKQAQHRYRCASQPQVAATCQASALAFLHVIQGSGLGQF